MSEEADGALFDVAPPEPAQRPAEEDLRPVTRGVVEDRPAPTGEGPRPPLAVRMRPASLDEVVGQDHLLAPGAPLRRLVEGAAPASVLLHGPPGTGKTTLARLISQATGRSFEALSALSAGVKEVRGVIEVARRRLAASDPRRTVLFIDEIHRFSRTQQDALLGAVEDRVVLLVGATTENPSFSVVAPLLSRSLVLGLHALDDEAVGLLLDRAVADDRGLGGTVTLTDEARAHLVRLAAGDGRRSLTALEAAADAVTDEHGEITLAVVEQVVDEVAVRYDRAGDQHYDVISAFIKSIRGSDPDAALHYLARMIVAGEDPRFIARRLVVHASEDVGLADPTALQAATAAAQAVQLIGLPECRIALAQATIHLATAPKSNAVITAIDAAMSDIRTGAAGPVPPHLRDGHYAGAQKLGNAVGYRYPHDERAAVVAQQYPPDELVGRDYYEPSGRGEERAIAERLARLRDVVRG
ncbi:replication-associated recombination protein A [Actinomycetospora endophytica]|uniref:Replication-associated recombination protein A n=1 Tax=Actinomycetospora endophytica TaxID=2291215 RepID=A0ABS8PHS9_9PSEU|nr:replication-associated recombination protein A [Actinomycetospora endophytica]MCD2197800.1 replication-associated recombination protein A [Actinomycetospora endophytica]